MQRDLASWAVSLRPIGSQQYCHHSRQRKQMMQPELWVTFYGLISVRGLVNGEFIGGQEILSDRAQLFVQLMPERGQIDFNLGAHRR
jgi:hypothetical protein